MKLIMLFSMIFLSFNSMAKTKFEAQKIKAKVVNAKAGKAAEVPCDTKEDVLKKLEEKKKADAALAAPKGFSLQGGNTGCTIK